MIFVRFLRFNIYFLFGFKYFYCYKYFLFFPIFQPRNDSMCFFYIYFNFFNKFFVRYFFEPGIGSVIFIKLLVSFYSLNVFGVDRLFFSFINFRFISFDFFLKNISIYNCEWVYVFSSFKRFNFIFCNPPYLSFNDLKFFYFNSIKEYKYALISKYDGVFDVFYIIKNAYDSLLNNGFLFLEHGYLQHNFVKKTMLLSGFINIFTYKDLSSLNRITIGEK